MQNTKRISGTSVPSSVLKSTLFATLPDFGPSSSDLSEALRNGVAASGKKFVVLDDDPTGTQTVHGVPVLTEWSIERLENELRQPGPVFFILTNSRSLLSDAAKSLNEEIASNLSIAAKRERCEYVVASRSDSTLRGHVAVEIDVLTQKLGPVDATLIIPFFEAGGRFTIDNIHYVAEGEMLVPAGLTPFAKDQAFGFESSDLREWISEKYQGRVAFHEVRSISLEDIRKGGPDLISEILMELPSPCFCIVNAAAQRDVELFTLGLLKAEGQGRRFLYRTAASFVAARSGISQRALLNVKDLGPSSSAGGLIVVGSYVPKTTEQLQVLLAANPEIRRFEVTVDQCLVNSPSRTKLIKKMEEDISVSLQAGQDVVIHTSRDLKRGNDANDSLSIGKQVSDTLVAIVQSLKVRPRYLLAKGGITSSDLATKGLNVKRSLVLGQILPGVPVWQCGPESHFPSLAYIIFPGNVGNPEALSEVVSKLKRKDS